MEQDERIFYVIISMLEIIEYVVVTAGCGICSWIIVRRIAGPSLADYAMYIGALIGLIWCGVHRVRHRSLWEQILEDDEDYNEY